MTNRGFIHTIFFTAAFTGCFFLFACENDPKEIEVWTKEMVMVEEAKDIESYLSQDGKLKAKLTAPLMLRVMADTQYVEFPQSLHCDFYDDSTRRETWLDSKYGKYFENQNKVYLRDSVVVINIKGDTLKAPDLWWDQNAKLFYTDKFATYHGINRNIYGGKGMVATQDLGSITFKDPTGIVKYNENTLEQ
ncbi:MAG TPA: LPS export ABC transporter periplasmic protein LptC [Chitinophagaceae bacterium]|nr:LPS export ABC transporter periplasmic protein LptC [Chitinophagaceae bacterium]HEX5653524.1 LPS export ABC transporter periplasmic protein LptC [Chitinophagaceae bacterium]